MLSEFAKEEQSKLSLEKIKSEKLTIDLDQARSHSNELTFGGSAKPAVVFKKYSDSFNQYNSERDSQGYSNDPELMLQSDRSFGSHKIFSNKFIQQMSQANGSAEDRNAKYPQVNFKY